MSKKEKENKVECLLDGNKIQCQMYKDDIKQKKVHNINCPILLNYKKVKEYIDENEYMMFNEYSAKDDLDEILLKRNIVIEEDNSLSFVYPLDKTVPYGKYKVFLTSNKSISKVEKYKHKNNLHQ